MHQRELPLRQIFGVKELVLKSIVGADETFERGGRCSWIVHNKMGEEWGNSEINRRGFDFLLGFTSSPENFLHSFGILVTIDLNWVSDCRRRSGELIEVANRGADEFTSLKLKRPNNSMNLLTAR